MKIIKILTILVIITFLKISAVSAQFIHEVSVDAGIGSSTLLYKLSQGVRSGGFGGDFGLGYTIFSARERVTGTGKVFRELWGIHTGLGIGLYNASADLNKISTVAKGLDDGDIYVIDPKYKKFDLHTTLNSYTEIQKTVFLNIPVMALFQIEQIYVMGGLKFGIPVSGKYSSKNATLTNTGYYTELDNSAKDQEFAGYGTFKGKDFEGNLKRNAAVILAFEAGYKWFIADNLSVYTGLYFDCGLNNVIKSSPEKFINYNNQKPKDFTTNSVLSSYTDSGKSITFTDKTKIMAVGIKLRFAMEQ